MHSRMSIRPTSEADSSCITPAGRSSRAETAPAILKQSLVQTTVWKIRIQLDDDFGAGEQGGERLAQGAGGTTRRIGPRCSTWVGSGRSAGHWTTTGRMRSMGR